MNSDNTERDPAEYNEASCDFDYPPDSLTDILTELLQTGGVPAIVHFIEQRDNGNGDHNLNGNLRQLVALFFDPRSTNPRHWGLARAVDIDAVRPLTDEQIGDHCGVTKAAISKEARSWLKLLGLPPPRSMKTERACASYRQVRLNSSTHARMSG